MQKFKFKLDGLLKLREFKEKKIKIEIGTILKDIKLEEDKINAALKSIDQAYLDQEESLNNNRTLTGKNLYFYPYFIAGKNAEIAERVIKVNKLKEQYESKLIELKIARGEVKVMENFKEKKKSEWVKYANKKEQESIDDILMMRLQDKSR